MYTFTVCYIFFMLLHCSEHSSSHPSIHPSRGHNKNFKVSNYFIMNSFSMLLIPMSIKSEFVLVCELIILFSLSLSEQKFASMWMCREELIPNIKRGKNWNLFHTLSNAEAIVYIINGLGLKLKSLTSFVILSVRLIRSMLNVVIFYESLFALFCKCKIVSFQTLKFVSAIDNGCGSLFLLLSVAAFPFRIPLTLHFVENTHTHSQSFVT